MYQDLEDGGRLSPKPPPPGSARYVQVWRRCRHCPGCLADRARDFGIRGYHESKMATESAFITWTYDEAHLPQGRNMRFSGGMLSVRDEVLFFKRLRKAYSGATIRVLGCAEYGERTLRAHGHANLYLDHHSELARDRVPWGQSKTGVPLFRSPPLEAIWGMGNVTIQDCDFASNMYCSRHATKVSHLPGLPVCMRADGYIPKAHRKWRVNPETGKRFYFEPSYLIASRRPGLGYSFLEKYFMDIWTSQAVVVPGGQHMPIPEFYVRKITEWCEADGQLLKELRKTKMVDRYVDSMPRRLQDAELCAKARRDQFQRDAI